MQRARAVIGEGKAAGDDEAAPWRTLWRLGRGIGGQSLPASRDALEAAGTVVLERYRRAERRQRGALAVGLLEAHPRLSGASRGEHYGARINRRLEPPADRGKTFAVPAGGATRPTERVVQACTLALRDCKWRGCRRLVATPRAGLRGAGPRRHRR